MTGCIDRKTGKVTLVSEGMTAEQINAIVRRLLSAATVVKGAMKSGTQTDDAVRELRADLGG